MRSPGEKYTATTKWTSEMEKSLHFNFESAVYKVLLILMLTLLSSAYLFGSYWWLAITMIPVQAIAIRFGSIYSVNLSTLILLAFLVPRLFPSQPPFIVMKISGVLIFGICVVLAKPLRQDQGWLQVGQINRSIFLYMAAIVLISSLSLIGWTFTVSPNIAGYQKLLPDMPVYLVFVYIFLFAVTNAAIEEIMWRGVMLSSLEKTFGAGLFSNIAQALSFGFAHFHGPFLYGWAGVALTTVFGMLVGLLRQKSQGMLAPWVTHAVSDFVILCLVYSFVSRFPVGN